MAMLNETFSVIFKHRAKVGFVIGTTFSQHWKLSFKPKEGPLIQTEHLTFRPRLAPRKRPGQDMLGTTNKVTPLLQFGQKQWLENEFFLTNYLCPLKTLLLFNSVLYMASDDSALWTLELHQQWIGLSIEKNLIFFNLFYCVLFFRIIWKP